jgi:hypothetical protein
MRAKRQRKISPVKKRAEPDVAERLRRLQLELRDLKLEVACIMKLRRRREVMNHAQ